MSLQTNAKTEFESNVIVKLQFSFIERNFLVDMRFACRCCPFLKRAKSGEVVWW